MQPHQGIAGRPLNVLIVEDSVEDAERAVLELRRAGYAPDYRRVATNREMSAALDERPWDLVLCAYRLSDFTYEGALALVREKRIPAPVLLVSAAVVDEAAVSAVKAGARDIIMKDRLSRLAHAVERELEAARNRIRQRALEESIRRSEKRFRALIEHSFDAVCLLDAQAVVLYASPSAERILGYTAEELVGRNAFELVAQEDRPLAQQRLGEVLAMPAQTLTLQLRVIRKDGDVIWTEHFGTNLLDEESVAAVVVNFRDITGQKRFEQILRENEERAQRELAELEHIYHTAPVGLCLIGADLRYLRINERLAAINGLPADDHLGRTVWEVIPEAAPFVAPLLLRIIESGRPVLDWQFRTEKSAPGGPRDLLASYYPVQAASGTIIGVAGVVQEITELKRVERALRESEQRFRALIENSADGFVLLDRRGKQIYSGPPILGYENLEFRGRSVLDLIHPDERPGLPGAFAAFLARPGAVVTSEHRVQHKDGSWRWIEAVSKNLLGDRVIAGIVVNYRDVTERKRLEEQLRQTQKLESIGVLAGGVAHDFNNLLTGVLGNATLALDAMGPKHAGRSNVEEVMKAAESAAHLTRQLLA
jgi:PAS domain S-box-containing protein